MIMEQDSNVQGDIMTTSVFFTLTMDLFYKCNYAATLEGLVFNKMIVDTVYMTPDFIPYWIKSIIFFIVTVPMNLFTLVDDAIAGLFLYQRINAHYDFFDFGIVAGKLVRILFQTYFGLYMTWDYMLSKIHWKHLW